MSAADPTAAFLRGIRQSGLLDEGQCDDLARWSETTAADVREAAKEVFRRRWLTPYQIKEIFKGRGRELVLGPYVLLDLLGEGGMGRVFRAHHARLGRDVALKVIRKEKLSNPAAAGRFRAEIQALASMAHPNVVAAYDADQVGDTHFCVMELIDGTDLTQVVRTMGKLPVAEACEYIRQAAQGLQHAHEMGLVHRDVKPSNLILTRTGRQVKVVDLGLARVADVPEARDAHRITQLGLVLGTPDFLAPEQARNPAGVDIRADVYALGGTLYFLLTGESPYEGGTPSEKLVRHCTDAPPNLLLKRPDAPPYLAQLIQWFMAKRPEDRPQTPAEMAASLQVFCPPPQTLGPGGYAPQASAGVPAPLARPVPPTGQALPLPTVDPAPSSQIFRLPEGAAKDDPIRRRAERRSPTTPLLFLLAGLLLLSIFGYAGYRVLVGPPPAPLEASLTNELGMKLILLDGGTFRMGSKEGELGRQSDEGPVREVALTGKFYIGAAEVTQGEYATILSAHPSASGKLGRNALDLPVENVSWEEAVEFCKRLTKEHGPRDGWAYRLPTEAEWEFACRAGTGTAFSFGEKLAYPKHAAFAPGPDDEDPLAESAPDAKPAIMPERVGKLPANAWGLHDMHGNVAEWCHDWYARSYPPEGRENPRGPADGDRKVVRGGSWRDPASACRSAARRGLAPSGKEDRLGFRVVYAPVAAK